MRFSAAVLVGLLWAGPVAAQQQPRTDLEALLVRADTAWAHERHRDAFVAYDSVVRADSAYSTRALYRVGLLHAWANRFAPSVAALRLYVRLEPRDSEGRIALARTHAWANQFTEALAQYDTVLASDAGYRDAVTGRATTLAWSGQLVDADSALAGWLRVRPQDVEAWSLLAQFRRWQGNPRGAKLAIAQALSLRPDDAEARRQQAWVNADLNPWVGSTVINTKDSERNALTHLEVQGGLLTAGDLRLSAVARVRDVSQGPASAITVPSVHGVAQMQLPGTLWAVRAELGAVDFPAQVGSGSLQGRGGLRGYGPLGRRWRLSAGIGREPLDEVLSMARRELMFTSADADASYAISSRLNLGLAASHGALGGVGVARRRSTALAALRYTPRRGATFTAQHREAGWNDPAFGVFFAPQRWTVTELAASYERPAELGMILGADIALGSQGIRFTGGDLTRSLAPRGTLRAGWRPKPGREVVASLLYANVAGAGAITASAYRYGAFTLTGRWTF